VVSFMPYFSKYSTFHKPEVVNSAIFEGLTSGADSSLEHDVTNMRRHDIVSSFSDLQLSVFMSVLF